MEHPKKELLTSGIQKPDSCSSGIPMNTSILMVKAYRADMVKMKVMTNIKGTEAMEKEKIQEWIKFEVLNEDNAKESGDPLSF